MAKIDYLIGERGRERRSRDEEEERSKRGAGKEEESGVERGVGGEVRESRREEWRVEEERRGRVRRRREVYEVK